MPEPFVYRLRVRYAECDAQGVVFNAHYLAFVDHALTELWREAFGGYAAMTERGVDIVVAESHMRFLASARFDEELDIEIAVAQLGTTSMTLANRIIRAADRTPLVEVRMRYVWVEVTGWTKTAIPQWARAALAPRLVPDPGAV